MKFFLVVEDFCRASIGPFESEQACRDHHKCARTRGDSAALIGVRMHEHDPDADLKMTPQEDKEWQP